MAGRRVESNRNGMRKMVEIPDDAPDEHHRFGVLIGPPDLSGLGLPRDLEKRLNNALFDRGIITKKDAKPDALFGALQAVFKVDVTTLLDLYRGEGVK